MDSELGFPNINACSETSVSFFLVHRQDRAINACSEASFLRQSEGAVFILHRLFFLIDIPHLLYQYHNLHTLLAIMNNITAATRPTKTFTLTLEQSQVFYYGKGQAWPSLKRTLLAEHTPPKAGLVLIDSDGEDIDIVYR